MYKKLISSLYVFALPLLSAISDESGRGRSIRSQSASALAAAPAAPPSHGGFGPFSARRSTAREEALRVCPGWPSADSHDEEVLIIFYGEKTLGEQAQLFIGGARRPRQIHQVARVKCQRVGGVSFGGSKQVKESSSSRLPIACLVHTFRPFSIGSGLSVTLLGTSVIFLPLSSSWMKKEGLANSLAAIHIKKMSFHLRFPLMAAKGNARE